MSDVFVSYKAEDRRRVRHLVEALEADGYSVWWDEQIGGGAAWRQAIEAELNVAKCVIVAWSKRSVGPEGTFVQDEATRAQQRRVYVPVTIDKVQVPLGFGEMQALSLTSWKGDRSDARYQAVLSAVRRIAGGTPAPAPHRVVRAPVSRRAVVGGGAVAAVATLGGSAWMLLKSGSSGTWDSIAVLPFANLSDDPAQAYFSDGLAEELRSSLSRIAKLKVVARTSSEVVRGEDARTAAYKLGVANVLTGSVRRSPTMIRVSAQLVDGVKGVERWSQIYNRTSGDALEIQTDIADMVAQALSIQLSGDVRGRLAEGRTNNAAAQDLLLKARASMLQDGNEASLLRAIGMIDAALALDPNYADALSEKAYLIRWQAGLYSKSAAESQGYYVLATATAKHAIRLAPHRARSYSSLAIILSGQLNRRAAQLQWEKALSMPGIDGPALANYATFLSEIKRHAEAIQAADRAIALDPLNPVVFVVKAIILVWARRYTEAVQSIRRASKLGKNLVFPHALHAFVQMMLGNSEQARVEFAALNSSDGQTMAWQSVLAARQGDMIESDRILARLRTLFGDAVHYQSAQVLAQQGKKEQALQVLKMAMTARDPGLNYLLVDPMLDPIRGDRRFQALVKELDFPT